ncbi:MAG TPA: PAS domain S-box protein [Candidatus Aenigmarchaeota archaeon]|nr:PAS domain S-box protein [Candidatus Aenigmarchaeota archaeon]
MRSLRSNENELEKYGIGLKNILSSMDDFVFVLDKAGKFIFYHAPKRAKVYIPEEFMGRKITEVMPSHFNNTFKKVFGKAKKGKSSEFEYWLEINGEKRWYSAKLSPISLHGKFKGAVAIVRDITEKKKFREKLEESEEKFRALSSAARDAIIMMNDEGLVTYWNKAAEKMFGYKQKEILGKVLHFLLAPKRFHAAYRRGIKKFVKTGKGPAVGKTLELVGLKKDGTEFPVELSLSSVKIKGRWHAIGIVRDITERKKIESILEESERRYREFFETANDLIQSIDERGNFLYVNKKWLRTLGYTKEEAKRMNIMDILRSDYVEHCKKVLKRLSKGENIQNVETVFITKKGKEIYVEGNLSGRFRNGKFVGTLGIFRDITERKKMEEEMRKRSEELMRANKKASELVEELKMSQKELQGKVEELEKFKRITINRELRMIELKKEIRKLREELEKYKQVQR